MNIDGLLSTADKLARKVPAEALHSLSGVYELRIAGEGCVHARISGGGIALGPGGCAGALCSAETDAETIDALLSGSIRPARAIMSGKVRLNGDAKEVMRLARLLIGLF